MTTPTIDNSVTIFIHSSNSEYCSTRLWSISIQINNTLRQSLVIHNHCGNYLNHNENCSTISSPIYGVEGDKTISFNNVFTKFREMFALLPTASPLSSAGKKIVNYRHGYNYSCNYPPSLYFNYFHLLGMNFIQD